MAGWYTGRRSTTLNRSAKAVIAIVLLAVALVFAVPVAFIVALFLMLFGHVVGGLILIACSVLAATAAVAAAALCGVRQVRHLREMLTGGNFMTVGNFAHDGDVPNGPVLRLDADDYDRS
jgi:uncharacterized membrane protein